MVGVFAIFATLPIIDMKEMGIGLAAAVLIDATIVRAVLLPATMKLLGDWNWYLPTLARVAAPPRARRRPRGPGRRPDPGAREPLSRRRDRQGRGTPRGGPIRYAPTHRGAATQQGVPG